MQAPERKSNKQVINKLLLIVVGMFGFGFAMVPIYDVFCDITGLNGKTATEAAQANARGIDVSREITVQFISHPAKDMPWQFRPEVSQISVRPGETKFVNFYAKNDSSSTMVGQSVPSVAPGRAANYFKKVECFCFEQQTLEGQEEVLMPLQFYIDADIPDDVKTLTLSYTLYDITTKTES